MIQDLAWVFGYLFISDFAATRRMIEAILDRRSLAGNHRTTEDQSLKKHC